jgi:hypothetical protein
MVTRTRASLEKDDLMTQYIPSTEERFDSVDTGVESAADIPRNVGRPSNEVYARVGDTVLRAAREGVRGGMRPEDIIREIVSDHHIRLNLSEFRLLLASRRIGDRDAQPVSTTDPHVVLP